MTLRDAKHEKVARQGRVNKMQRIKQIINDIKNTYGLTANAMMAWLCIGILFAWCSTVETISFGTAPAFHEMDAVYFLRMCLAGW